MKLNGINWLFKKKKIKETKKCLDCDNQAKSNVAKYCIECSLKRMTANNSKQSLRRYHKNKEAMSVTFNPYKLCPDWDKLNERDRKVVFKWFADRGSCN